MRLVQRPIFAGVFALAASFVACAMPAAAQTASPAWPQRPVRFLLPLGPGSGVDIGAAVR